MEIKTDTAPPKGYLAKIERLGNALPDPSFIFIWLILMALKIQITGKLT